VAEKPDVLWDRPDLERLYARLEDEYEPKERVDALTRKLAIIGDTTTAITGIIDTQRSLHLEMTIAFLIGIRNRHRVFTNRRHPKWALDARLTQPEAAGGESPRWRRSRASGRCASQPPAKARNAVLRTNPC
jgi:hypothetical protein